MAVTKGEDAPPEPRVPEMAARCTCGKELHLDPPPEAGARKAQGKSDLRQITCPACGMPYWTNRRTDLCIDCERSGRRPLR